MKVVSCFSGGLDSTVLLYHLRKEHEVYPISFEYGQRHRKELEAACELAPDTAIVSISGLSLAGNALTDPSVEVPDGHYEEPTMKITVVPNRNMVFLSLATAYAISLGACSVQFAAHAGDHAIYPDCRLQFITALNDAIREGTYRAPFIQSLFVNWSKADIVSYGDELKVPFERTWSCYKGGDIHCGTCATCTERKEAFALAGITDPTSYAA